MTQPFGFLPFQTDRPEYPARGVGLPRRGVPLEGGAVEAAAAAAPVQRRLLARRAVGEGDGDGAAAGRGDGRRRVRAGPGVRPRRPGDRRHRRRRGVHLALAPLDDGERGGGVVVDRVHGGEQAEVAARPAVRAERVVPVPAVAAAAASATAAAARHVEERLVREGTLQAAATTAARPGGTTAHLRGKLKSESIPVNFSALVGCSVPFGWYQLKIKMCVQVVRMKSPK